MPRVWRSRRSLDMPRPAGRRWARLRRSGSRATQVIASVTRVRRPRDSRSADAAHAGTQVVYPRPERWPRLRPRRTDSMTTLDAATLPIDWIAPDDLVAPRSTPRVEPEERSTPVTIPLLPGERTPARRLKFAVANGCTVGSLLLGMMAVFLAIAGDLRLAALALLACVVVRRLRRWPGPQVRRGQPVRRPDGLAGRPQLVRRGHRHRGLPVARRGGTSPVAAGPACALVAVCAAIRLARFNVSPKDGRFFCGVPTTMAAAVLALDILIGPHLPAGVAGRRGRRLRAGHGDVVPVREAGPAWCACRCGCGCCRRSAR